MLFNRFGALLILSAMWATPVKAITLEGVDVSESKVISGITLNLNGAGVRTATVFNVRLYVAAFYTPQPLKTPEEVFTSNGPLRFDFTFLRPFIDKKVEDAWRWQFEQSSSHRYDGYEKDAGEFSAMFGAVKKYGVETVEIEGDETRVYNDGVLRGSIKGKEFQKSFLTLWFGPKPVMNSLKAQLLGRKK